MKEELIDCLRCQSNACSKITDEDTNYEVYICMGCGFTSSPGCTMANKEIIEENLPELYKDLRFEDKEGHLWYPTSINLPNKGIVFVDGASVTDWKWAAVPVRPIEEEEKIKYPKGTTHIPDMKNIEHFSERDFMDALEVIEYFKGGF